jgi:uncharacterized protein with PQ loop repeat
MINNILVTTATIMDILKIYPQYTKIQDTGDVSAYSKESLIMGIFTCLLWLIYHSRTSKDYSNLFCTIGIAVTFQMYILLKVFKYEKKKLKTV